MRAADLTTAVVLFVLGGVVLVDALRLGIGWGTDGPKSGFFPFWLAVLLMVSCAAVSVQAARRTVEGAFVTRAQLIPVLKMILPVAGFVVVTDPPGPWDGLGLYVSAALYIAVYMRWLGRHPWWLVALLGIGIPVVVFLVFERWFLVPMPKGPLEAWLGY